MFSVALAGCTEKIEKRDTVEEAGVNDTSELGFVKLEGQEKFNASLHEKASDLLWEKVISKTGTDRGKLLFCEDGMAIINTDENGEQLTAYMIHLRADTGTEVTYTYGLFAVQLSTENIYEYDFSKCLWHRVDN